MGQTIGRLKAATILGGGSAFIMAAIQEQAKPSRVIYEMMAASQAGKRNQRSIPRLKKWRRQIHD